MKYSALIAIIAACVSSVAADGTIVLCKDVNLHDCESFPYQNGVCNNLGSDLVNEVSSVDINGDGHKCHLWVNTNCPSGQDNFAFTKHHNTLPDPFDDSVSSWKCDQ